MADLGGGGTMDLDVNLDAEVPETERSGADKKKRAMITIDSASDESGEEKTNGVTDSKRQKVTIFLHCSSLELNEGLPFFFFFLVGLQ